MSSPWLLLLALVMLLGACATAPVDQELVKDYILMAEAAVKDKQYDQARKYYLRILQLDPKRTEVRYDLLTMVLRLSDWAAASELATQLLKEDPRNGFLLESQAFIYANTEEYDKAYAMLAEVFENGLRRESVIRNLFALAGKLGKKDDQFRWGEELHRAGKADSDMLLAIIGSGLQGGKEQESKSYIDEFMVANAQDTKKLLALGEVYAASAYYSRAIDLADMVWEKDKLNPEVLILRIKARLLAQDAPDSINSDLVLFSATFPTSTALLGDLLGSLPPDKSQLLKTYLETKKDPASSDGAGSDVPVSP